jgi:hypothetical protein
LSDQPWDNVCKLQLPVVLNRSKSAVLDHLFDLPEHSALTLARIDPKTGRIDSVDWRQTGERGFYPASTVKVATAAMTLQLLDDLNICIDAVVQVGDEPAMTFRELLAETIVFSGNDTFNALAECVGFAESHAQLQSWGVVKFLLRRHFKNPRYNHSRLVRIFNPDGSVQCEIPPRPPATIPLHDGNGLAMHNRESNWACTDDLVRIFAAILFGPTRRSRYFRELTGWLGMTNRCHIRQGLRRLTAEHPDHPGFVILNKPGWWEPDLANIDMAYIYDCHTGSHYLLAVYFHGTVLQADQKVPSVSYEIFSRLVSDGSGSLFQVQACGL